MQILLESLAIRKEIGDRGGMAWCLEKIAEIAHLREDEEHAARLLGAAASIRASVNSVVDPADQNTYNQLVEQIRINLTADLFLPLWAEGEGMSLDHVFDYALSFASSP